MRFAIGVAALLIAGLIARNRDRDLPYDLHAISPYAIGALVLFSCACFSGIAAESICYLGMLCGFGTMVVYFVWTVTEEW